MAADELHARKVCLWGKVRDLGAGRSVEELDVWARGPGIAFSHIYISKVAHGSVYWGTLVASAREVPNYAVPIDNDDVAVLERAEPLGRAGKSRGIGRSPRLPIARRRARGDAERV